MEGVCPLVQEGVQRPDCCCRKENDQYLLDKGGGENQRQLCQLARPRLLPHTNCQAAQDQEDLQVRYAPKICLFGLKTTF